MPNKVAIIGIGNVGTFLSAAILQSDNCDELIAVEKNLLRIQQLAESGFCYKIADSDSVEIKSDKVKIVPSLHGIETRFNTVFIATKGYDLTKEFYKSDVEPFLEEGAKVVLVQNGYPNPEILEVVGNNAVIMVVNAGFSLDENGVSATNKTIIDLPYGDLSKRLHREDLEQTIGKLSTEASPQIQIRYDSNIENDILKKAQYACVGAYCAVEAFTKKHNKKTKFTFGNLRDSDREEFGEFTKKLRTEENFQIDRTISDIVQEIQNLSEIPLLCSEEIQERMNINTNIENSLVTDARNGRKLEREIVDNLLLLSRKKNLASPTLENLSKALEIIERDGWNLEQNNVRAVNNLFPTHHLDLPYYG